MISLFPPQIRLGLCLQDMVVEITSKIMPSFTSNKSMLDNNCTLFRKKYVSEVVLSSRKMPHINAVVPHYETQFYCITLGGVQEGALGCRLPITYS